MTCNEKYPIRDYENLTSPIPMQLSLKRKTFSNNVVPYLEFTSNFKHFETKDDHRSYFISEITDYEGIGYTNV